MRLLLLSIGLILAFSAQAARERFTAQSVDFSIAVRPVEGTVAFYTARGFPKDMVQAIARTCFVGVGMHNGRDDVLWLELAHWRFSDAEGHEVKRITRPTWDALWEQMGAPLAARATFDWTQLPESRDLQPGEPVGGNVAVETPAGEFALTATFRTGKGETFQVQVPGLDCKAEGDRP